MLMKMVIKMDRTMTLEEVMMEGEVISKNSHSIRRLLIRDQLSLLQVSFSLQVVILDSGLVFSFLFLLVCGCSCT